MAYSTKKPARRLRRSMQLAGFVFCAISFVGCGVFATRPDRHLSYAEAAHVAAQKANAEVLAPNSYQLARETLFRARSSYRLKNFKLARRLSIRSRLLAEEAEFRSLHKDAAPKDNPPTTPE